MMLTFRLCMGSGMRWYICSFSCV